MISSDFLLQFKSIFPLIYVWGEGRFEARYISLFPLPQRNPKDVLSIPPTFPSSPFSFISG